jgi:hypothetical protein
MRSMALAVALAVCGCATPPRSDQLADLEQRVARQRERSAAIEGYLRELEPAVVPPPPPAGSVPYYELVVLRSEEPLDARYEPDLRAQLARELTASGAKQLEYRGVDPARRFSTPWSGQQFEGLSLAALFASAYAAAPQYRGAEFDVRVSLSPGPDRLVTVIHGLDGQVSAVDAVAPGSGGAARGPGAEELRARYGIGPVEGWSATERAALDRALSLLHPSELAGLAGLPFRRKGSSSGLLFGSSSSRHCGHFELERESRSIAVYDCAFDADEAGFVGSLARPLSPSVRVILHEVAHALAAGPIGELLVGVTTSHREAQEMVDAFNHLGRSVPAAEIGRIQALQRELEKLQLDLKRWQAEVARVEHLNSSAVRGFLAREGAASGFTPYGRSTAIEGFAEAFSVCRSDPDAGLRISKQACAYFDSAWVRSAH